MAWTVLGVVLAVGATALTDAELVGDRAATTVVYQCADGETRDSPCPQPPTTPAPTATTTEPPRTTEAPPTTGSSPTTAAPSPSPGPATTIPPGIYAVGEDIEPGRYHASGRGNCSWATLRDDSGEPEAVMSSGVSQGGSHQTSVDIGEQVAYFESHGCGTWAKG